MKSSIEILKQVSTPEGALFASAGELYRDAVFGRDALEAAEDILRFNGDIAKNVIICLAELQGTKYDSTSEEEPGKIHHEHRALEIGGQRISEASEEIFYKLAEKWGEYDGKMTYYGSADSTPLYVRLVCDYAEQYGEDFLETQVFNRDGERITVRDSLMRALDYVAVEIDNSPAGLLEYKRQNIHGLPIQSWKDSATSHQHTDGSQVNLSQPIASLEVQAYAFDALRRGSRLLHGNGLSPHMADAWLSEAMRLQEEVLNRFWIPGNEQFAMALDRDSAGNYQKVRTPASNQGILLSTGLLDGLPADQREAYVAGIVTALYNDDFLTETGIRCRGISAKDVVDFWDYHGSHTVWVKENFDFIKGLHAYGLTEMALQLGARVLNGDNISGEKYEFKYVDEDGLPDYFPSSLEYREDADHVIVGTNVPEWGQAWTASAIQALKRYNHHNEEAYAHMRKVSSPSEDLLALEQELIGAQPKLEPLKTKEEISHAQAQAAQRKTFAIDLETGRQKDSRWNPDWWS